VAKQSDEAFNLLVDADAPTEPGVAGMVVLRLPEGSTFSTATEAVEAVLEADHIVATVRIVVGDRLVGATSARYLSTALGIAAHTPDDRRGVGDGDGATLPGASAEFVLLRYRCRRPVCGTQEFRLIHDERQPVMCPVCGETMELTT
jgi:hypothetical protein